MAAVVREMIEVARTLLNIDVAPMLRSSERGVRLAAYVYLYVRPKPAHLVELVHSVTAREDKPFGQYWGLQAIGLNLSGVTSEKLPAAVVMNLTAYASRVQRGTDRDYEVRRILKKVGISV